MFNIEEYTDERIRAVMAGHTCRQCANRVVKRYGDRRLSTACFCTAHRSGRTTCGMLRVRIDQPACILFEMKERTTK